MNWFHVVEIYATLENTGLPTWTLSYWMINEHSINYTHQQAYLLYHKKLSTTWWCHKVRYLMLTRKRKAPVISLHKTSFSYHMTRVYQCMSMVFIFLEHYHSKHHNLIIKSWPPNISSLKTCSWKAANVTRKINNFHRLLARNAVKVSLTANKKVCVVAGLVFYILW